MQKFRIVKSIEEGIETATVVYDEIKVDVTTPVESTDTPTDDVPTEAPQQ